MAIPTEPSIPIPADFADTMAQEMPIADGSRPINESWPNRQTQVLRALSDNNMNHTKYLRPGTPNRIGGHVETFAKRGTPIALRQPIALCQPIALSHLYSAILSRRP